MPPLPARRASPFTSGNRPAAPSDRGRLSCGKRLIDRELSGNRARDALADHRAERLELRDPDIRDARVRHLLGRRIGRIGGLDRTQHEVGERRGSLVLGALIRRRARAGGTEAQPSSLPTISMYCFDVAHVTNVFAASCCFDVFGIASAHAHSQCEPFGVSAIGAAAKPILSATCDCCLL